MAALAASLGCEFTGAPEPGIPYQMFPVFVQAQGWWSHNTIRGVWTCGGRPYPVRMGDYQHQNQDGTWDNTALVNYIVVQLPFRAVPDLVIRHKGPTDRLARALGFAPITFESEEFGRKFVVGCTDRKFAYAVVTAKMMEFLLSSDGPEVEIRDGRCCIASAAYWPATVFRARLAWLERFIKLWPSYLLEELDAGRT